jgi:uncharacterized protein YkwD
MIQQMLKLHNEVRKKHNLHPLSLHPKLRGAAQQHALYMQKHDKLTHEGPGGSDCGSRIKKEGYHWANCAENIASGGGELGTPEKIFDNWMKSTAGHKENILHKDMHDVGFGSASRASGERYWVSDFAKQQR